MESVWQIAARKKFPTASIEGDGPFAFYSACSLKPMVKLYWFAFEAQQATCLHAFCKQQHAAYQLKPAVQGTGFQAAHTVGYGRD
jgi:hypothetical protein